MPQDNNFLTTLINKDIDNKNKLGENIIKELKD